MITISWSTIDSFHKCPLRVKKELEDKPHSHSWAMGYAEAGHVGLKAWANDEDYMDAFMQRCSEYEHRTANIKNWDGTFTDTETGITQKAQIKDLLQKYTEQSRMWELGNQDPQKPNPLKPDPSLVELYLSRDLGDGVLLTGRIDAVGIPVIDWKFTSSPKYLNKIQGIIYSILNGGPCQFDFHVLVKARNPYCDVISVPETQRQENLDRVTEYVIKPIAKQIELAIADPTLWTARPDEYLCQEKYCGYWKDCEGRFV